MIKNWIMSHGRGIRKEQKKVSHIIWMAPKTNIYQLREINFLFLPFLFFLVSFLTLVDAFFIFASFFFFFDFFTFFDFLNGVRNLDHQKSFLLEAFESSTKLEFLFLWRVPLVTSPSMTEDVGKAISNLRTFPNYLAIV